MNTQNRAKALAAAMMSAIRHAEALKKDACDKMGDGPEYLPANMALTEALGLLYQAEAKLMHAAEGVEGVDVVAFSGAK